MLKNPISSSIAAKMSTEISGDSTLSKKHRIDVMDAIRGLALLGIFLMNIEWFVRPIVEMGTGVDQKQSGIDWLASWFIYVFVQGKFWTLFSILFGMGFSVMFSRRRGDTKGFIPLYLRRILGLFTFGFCHYVFVWTGDILHAYAIAGLALLLLVTRSWLVASVYAVLAIISVAIISAESAILILALCAFSTFMGWALRKDNVARYFQWGVALYALPMVVALLVTSASAIWPSSNSAKSPIAKAQHQEILEYRKEQIEAQEKQNTVYSSGTYRDLWHYHISKFRKDFDASLGLAFQVLPLFLIGVWFARSGIATDPDLHRKKLLLILRWSACLGLVGVGTSIFITSSFPFPEPEVANPMAQSAKIMSALGSLPLSLFYFTGLVLLFQSLRARRLLSLFIPAGKMALSNYIGASLISAFCFFGFGIGYWGQVPRSGQVVFVLIVFILQMMASHWWMKRFEFGPLEWLWRGITYLKMPKLRKAQPSIPADN